MDTYAEDFLAKVTAPVDLRGFTRFDRKSPVDNVKPRIMTTVARAWSMPSIMT